MITLLVSLFVALVGLLMCAFAANPKLVMVGYITYGAGLLVTLSTISPHALHWP